MRRSGVSGHFWALTAVLLAVMTAAGAPSPLYGVWQQQLHFSAATLTLIFAAYVFALLATLVVAGSLSDYIGRKPVLLAALAVELVSLVVFLRAGTVTWLIIARIVQGGATGAVMSTLGAALVDAQPPGSRSATLVNSVMPPLGLGLGALGAGAIVQLVPHDLDAVFWILIAVVAGLVVLTARLPESGARRAGAVASLAPRVRVPAQARAAFVLGLPIFVATWSVGSLYLSLGGSVARVLFGHPGGLVSGSVVLALTGTGAVACFLVRRSSPRFTSRVGAAALVTGLGVALAGVLVGQGLGFALFLVGTVIAGFGFGASFVGAFGAVMSKVGPDDRAETLTAVLTVSYLSFSVPALVAGIVVTHAGLRPVVIVYALAVMVLAAAAAVLAEIRRPAATLPQSTAGKPGDLSRRVALDQVASSS